MITFLPANRLTPRQTDQIRSLVDACVDYEGLSLSYPDLDGDEIQVYLFYRTKGEPPLSVLVAYPCEEYTEITAFTHPEHRCQGMFTALFDAYLSRNDEGPVCFYPDGNSYDALAVMETLECEYASTEHIMSCDLKNSPYIPFSSGLSLTACDELDVLAPIHSRAFELPLEESQSFLQESLDDDAICWLIQKEDTPIGLCLGTADEEDVYLYGFCIDPAWQGQKLGTESLALLLDCLRDAYRTVHIQVSEENEPAFRMYRKAGFVSTEELMEYWY